jgi:hypothetical protein
MKDKYNITLNAFSNYLIKNSSRRITVVKNICDQITSDFDPSQDYWLHLKNAISVSLSRNGLFDGIEKAVDKVPGDRKDNYVLMIEALKHWWGHKQFEKVTIRTRSWVIGKIVVSVSPEICGVFRGRLYIINLFLHKNEDLRKDQADMMNEIMFEALKEPITRIKDKHKDATIGTLDVKRNKLYSYREKQDGWMSTLLTNEASSLERMINSYLKDEI